MKKKFIGILPYQPSSTKTTNQRNETKNAGLFRQTHSLYKTLHCKKGLAVFLSSAGISLTKLPGGELKNYSRSGRVWLVSDIPAGDGKTAEFFLTVYCRVYSRHLRCCYEDIHLHTNSTDSNRKIHNGFR